jgi:hypothetical protein
MRPIVRVAIAPAGMSSTSNFADAALMAGFVPCCSRASCLPLGGGKCLMQIVCFFFA